jgi:hypothetical protein
MADWDLGKEKEHVISRRTLHLVPEGGCAKTGGHQGCALRGLEAELNPQRLLYDLLGIIWTSQTVGIEPQVMWVASVITVGMYLTWSY